MDLEFSSAKNKTEYVLDKCNSIQFKAITFKNKRFSLFTINL